MPRRFHRNAGTPCRMQSNMCDEPGSNLHQNFPSSSPHPYRLRPRRGQSSSSHRSTPTMWYQKIPTLITVLFIIIISIFIITISNLSNKAAFLLYFSPFCTAATLLNHFNLSVPRFTPHFYYRGNCEILQEPQHYRSFHWNILPAKNSIPKLRRIGNLPMEHSKFPWTLPLLFRCHTAAGQTTDRTFHCSSQWLVDCGTQRITQSRQPSILIRVLATAD